MIPVIPHVRLFSVLAREKKKYISRAAIPENACREVSEVSQKITAFLLRDPAVDKKKPAEAGREGPRSWRRGTEIVAIS